MVIIKEEVCTLVCGSSKFALFPGAQASVCRLQMEVWSFNCEKLYEKEIHWLWNYSVSNQRDVFVSLASVFHCYHSGLSTLFVLGITFWVLPLFAGRVYSWEDEIFLPFFGKDSILSTFNDWIETLYFKDELEYFLKLLCFWSNVRQIFQY